MVTRGPKKRHKIVRFVVAAYRDISQAKKMTMFYSLSRDPD